MLGEGKRKPSTFGIRSIKAKLASMFILSSVCVAAILGIFSVNFAQKTMTDNIQNQMVILAEQVSARVKASIETEFSFLEALTIDERINSMAEDDVSLKKYLQYISELRGIPDMGISDLSGKTLTENLVTYADISEREYFKKALEGENYVSDPFEDPTRPGNMIFMISVPIYRDGDIVGVLYMRMDGAALSDITDQVTFGETGSACMVNYQGTYIAHEERERVIAQENAIDLVAEQPELAGVAKTLEQVLQGGSGYSVYECEGVKKCVGYAEIPDFNWHVMVSSDYDELYAGISFIIYGIIILCIFVIIVFGVIGYIFAAKISSPIIAVQSKLEDMSHGDFTGDIPAKLLKSKDETGALVKATEQTQEQLRTTISEVCTASNAVSNFADNQNQELNALIESLESVSAVVEELAASSEETAASTEQMVTVANEAKSSLERIVTLAGDGSKTSREIMERANALEKSSIRSKENAVSIYQQSMQTLQQAIEDAKQIEEISKLSDAILSITAQTNLLALNASIEAARAGEAGKGFSVVASEIGHLAEDSKNSVSQIQQITGEVVRSVENLSRCAEDILKFLDETVMQDYENMTVTGKQYNQDADNFNTIVNRFDDEARKILKTVEYITSALTDITIATDESATGISSIAQNTTEITEKTNEIANLANETAGKAEWLNEQMKAFKIVEK